MRESCGCLGLLVCRAEEFVRDGAIARSVLLPHGGAALERVSNGEAAVKARVNWLQTFKRHSGIGGTIIIMMGWMGGRIRTILHFANENERYTRQARSPRPTSAPARMKCARTRNHVHTVHDTHRYKIGLLSQFLTHFRVHLGNKEMAHVRSSCFVTSLRYLLRFLWVSSFR